MPIDFFLARCQTTTEEKRFGICDDQSPAEIPAYLDFHQEETWIAVVENPNNQIITFTAIDKCIEIKDKKGNDISRCDGFLSYATDIVFVELKERDTKNKNWVPGGVEQLKSTIDLFRRSHGLQQYTQKLAYLANNKRPWFQTSQIMTMQQFQYNTGFVLRIQNRIPIP